VLYPLFIISLAHDDAWRLIEWVTWHTTRVAGSNLPDARKTWSVCRRSPWSAYHISREYLFSGFPPFFDRLKYALSTALGELSSMEACRKIFIFSIIY